MELQTIASKSGLPVRIIRYVLDHKVLHDGPVAQILGAKGQPRTLTEFEAFAVVIAGTLIEAGLRRGHVAQYMGLLLKVRFTLIRGLSDDVIGAVLATKYPATAQFANGSMVRITHNGNDTGWLPTPKKAGVEPEFVIEVNLATLRDRLIRKEKR